MKHTNKISLKQIDKSKFSTIDTNKTQMFVPTMLNPIRQKSSTKSKEILKKIYSNDKIVYPSKKREILNEIERVSRGDPSSKPIKSSSLRSVKYNPNKNTNGKSASKSPSQNSNYSFTNKKNIILDLDFAGISKDVSVDK